MFIKSFKGLWSAAHRCKNATWITSFIMNRKINTQKAKLITPVLQILLLLLMTH